MQLKMIAQFPIEFTCASCGQTVAMIDRYKTVDEDTNEIVVSDDYYSVVIFAHDNGDGNDRELLAKGTLVECLHALTSNCLIHETAQKTLALMRELFDNNAVATEVDGVVFVSDNFDNLPESAEDNRTEDDFFQDNFPNLTRH